MRDKSLKAKSVKRSSTKCIRKSRRRSNNFVTLRPLKKKSHQRKKSSPIKRKRVYRKNPKNTGGGVSIILNTDDKYLNGIYNETGRRVHDAYYKALNEAKNIDDVTLKLALALNDKKDQTYVYSAELEEKNDSDKLLLYHVDNELFGNIAFPGKPKEWGSRINHMNYIAKQYGLLLIYNSNEVINMITTFLPIILRTNSSNTIEYFTFFKMNGIFEKCYELDTNFECDKPCFKMIDKKLLEYLHQITIFTVPNTVANNDVIVLDKIEDFLKINLIPRPPTQTRSKQTVKAREQRYTISEKPTETQQPPTEMYHTFDTPRAQGSANPENPKNPKKPKPTKLAWTESSPTSQVIREEDQQTQPSTSFKVTKMEDQQTEPSDTSEVMENKQPQPSTSFKVTQMEDQQTELPRRLFYQRNPDITNQIETQTVNTVVDIGNPPNPPEQNQYTIPPQLRRSNTNTANTLQRAPQRPIGSWKNNPTDISTTTTSISNDRNVYPYLPPPVPASKIMGKYTVNGTEYFTTDLRTAKLQGFNSLLKRK